MKFSFSTISLTRFLKRARGESEAAQFGRDAHTDWRTVFFVFLALNLVSVVGSVFLYRQINQGEFFLVDKKEPAVIRTLDRFALEQTVAFFEDRRTRFDALKHRSLSTKDPFIPGLVPKE